jgi:hypothetical protein
MYIAAVEASAFVKLAPFAVSTRNNQAVESRDLSDDRPLYRGKVTVRRRSLSNVNPPHLHTD